MKTSPTPHTMPRQRGIALIASLIILLLMTVVAISVFRNNNLVEKMTGNTREKQRAFEAAQSALGFGEWWLTQQTTITVNPSCSTTTAPTTPQVCNGNYPTTAAAVAALQTYNSFKPLGMNVLAGGGLASSGDVKYAKNPGIYISTTGATVFNSPSNTLYYVTAIGYGGSNGATATQAIVQSAFTVNATTTTPAPTCVPPAVCPVFTPPTTSRNLGAA